MLHIADGESVAGTLRESGIPGVVLIYGDLMFEGPAPAGLDAEAWRETRARFITGVGYATLEEARQYLKACEDTLTAFSQHEEVVIWLSHTLSNQLILIKVLDWFSRQDLGAVKLSLICVGRYPGINRFAGLGQLQAIQLVSLADTRLPVGEAQYRTARAAWNAFTSLFPPRSSVLSQPTRLRCRLLLQRCDVIYNSFRQPITACLVQSARRFPSFVIRVRSLGQGSSSRSGIWRNRSSWGTRRFIR